jgi:glyoxylase-like metal-dependent hydrolase (beta-lactamase superfamily II)
MTFSKQRPKVLNKLLAVTALACCTTLSSYALAGAPEKKLTQVPGFYRVGLGDVEVTALYDGYVDLDSKLLKGASAKELQSLLARMFIYNSKGTQTAVNAYLVNTGTNLVLIDAGAAKCFGPTLGNIQNNIIAAGYELAQVDTVLLTHLHPDHACGLLTNDGKPAFPNADVRVAKAEADFWLSENIAAKAPKDNQPFFKMARDSVAPYASIGKFKTFNVGDTLVEGLSAVPTNGHTPGHTSYVVSSKSQSLIFWGDIVHSYAVQFVKPEVAIEFDTDSPKAIITRKKLFADAAKNKLWVAGAHLPFPGIGHVRTEPKGYAWVPVEFGPIRTDR